MFLQNQNIVDPYKEKKYKGKFVSFEGFAQKGGEFYTPICAICTKNMNEL